MNTPADANAVSGLVADEDVLLASRALDIRMLGGRAIGLFENHFIDLATAIAGPASAPRNGKGHDLRRENLCRLVYTLGGHGEIAQIPVDYGRVKLKLPDLQPAAHCTDDLLGQAIRIDGASRFAYLPLNMAHDIANISLDSTHTPQTLLTLSHWPANRTPQAYKANLSTQSALRYMAQARDFPDARIVTSDHFDLDGLASIYAFLAPEHAQRHAPLLIEVARLGDYARGTSRHALQVAFSLNHLAERTHTYAGVNESRQLLSTFGTLLPLVKDVIENTERYAQAYQGQWQLLERTEALMNDPRGVLEEYPNIDLAVFTLPPRPASRADRETPYHGLSAIPFHNRTRCGVLAIIDGSFIEIRQRYESWVERVSCKMRGRCDLAIFQHALQAQEQGTAQWRYDGVQWIMPALKVKPGGNSDFSAQRVLDELKQFLHVAPIAWHTP